MGNKEAEVVNRIHIIPGLKALRLKAQPVEPVNRLFQDLGGAPGDPLKELRLGGLEADKVITSVQAGAQDHWLSLQGREGGPQPAERQGGQVSPYYDSQSMPPGK